MLTSSTTPSSRRARRGLLAKAGAALALSGGLLAGMAVPAQAAVPTAAVSASVLDTAARYVGTPYVWGGSTPAGFDCSGYTSYVYRQLGINLPRTSSLQLLASRRISAAEAVPGDMVFFVSGNGSAYHAAIYAGNGYIYDAPGTGRAVALRKLWTTNVAYGRVLS